MRSLRLATLILLAAASHASASVRPVARPDRSAARTVSRMVMLPAGHYRPLYAAPGAQRVAVGAFALLATWSRNRTWRLWQIPARKPSLAVSRVVMRVSSVTISP